MFRIRCHQDFGAGLLFLLIGCVGLFGASGLAYGSSRNMGPGYFPFLLSCIVLILGAICLIRSIAFSGPTIVRPALRPIFVIFASILVFGVTVEFIGLFFSLILMCLVISFSRSDMKYLEVIPLAIVTAFASVILFVYILGQSMPAWWGR